MNLDDLKRTWEEEMTARDDSIDFEGIRRQVARADRRATVISAVEVLACVAVIAFVLVVWWIGSPTAGLHPLLQLGMLAMISSCVFVAWKIIRSRKVSTVDDWTLKSRLDIQIEKRERDIRLLTTVAYWYLGPLFLAIILASYGGYVQRSGSYLPDAGLWMYWLLCVALYVGIYALNRYAARTRLRPLLKKLYALRAELET